MQSLGLHLLLLNILSCAIMLQLQELQKHIFCLILFHIRSCNLCGHANDNLLLCIYISFYRLT